MPFALRFQITEKNRGWRTCRCFWWESFL